MIEKILLGKLFFVALGSFFIFCSGILYNRRDKVFVIPLIGGIVELLVGSLA